MFKRAVCLLALLSSSLAFGRLLHGEEPKGAPEPRNTVALAAVTNIGILLYGNPCKLYMDPAEEKEPPSAATGDLVQWEIDNQCGEKRTVELKNFVAGGVSGTPFNAGCQMKQSPSSGGGKEWIVCKVTKVVPMGTKFLTYKYDIRGDFKVDPKLIVRPPGKGLCDLCDKLPRPCPAAPTP